MTRCRASDGRGPSRLRTSPRRPPERNLAAVFPSQGEGEQGADKSRRPSCPGRKDSARLCQGRGFRPVRGDLGAAGTMRGQRGKRTARPPGSLPWRTGCSGEVGGGIIGLFLLLSVSKPLLDSPEGACEVSGQPKRCRSELYTKRQGKGACLFPGGRKIIPVRELCQVNRPSLSWHGQEQTAPVRPTASPVELAVLRQQYVPDQAWVTPWHRLRPRFPHGARSVRNTRSSPNRS